MAVLNDADGVVLNHPVRFGMNRQCGEGPAFSWCSGFIPAT